MLSFSSILAWVAIATFRGSGPETSVELHVDASDARMHMIHAVESLQVPAGPLVLAYAKWIPGTHAASGPIENLVNLHFFAGSEELQWRRDLVELNNFHLCIPLGVHQLTVKLDYLSPTGSATYSSGAGPETDSALAVINWNEYALWPHGVLPDRIRVAPSLTLPSEWKEGGSLDVEKVDGNTVTFVPTSAALLVDHPVVAGQHFSQVQLFPASSEVGEHAIDIVADSDLALHLPDRRIASLRNLVRETRAIFHGVGHYRKYHWLLTLSDHLGTFGTEHYECSDCRGGEALMSEEPMSRFGAALLPHEFFHSWNGKTLRPSGLVNGGFEKPMKDDGLWVYEGMTDYYGYVLATRCGLITKGDFSETLAAAYAFVNRPGRSWRPLQDTADSEPYLDGCPDEWSGLRRAQDYYDEGDLLWLEADATIREATHGGKSLDDFCAGFEGNGRNGNIYLQAYGSEDIYKNLNRIVPFDWKSFFETKLQSKDSAAPQSGLTAAGYRLTWNDSQNRSATGHLVLSFSTSLGLRISPDGSVIDSFPGYPGYQAGIPVGGKILAVNGHQYSEGALTEALIAAEKDNVPLEVSFSDGINNKIVKIDYHGGLRIPHLERIPGATDVISQIVAPRTKASP